MRYLAGLFVALGLGSLSVVACSSSEPAGDTDAGDLSGDSGSGTPEAGGDAATSTPPETFDCAWIQSAKNCWGEALREATACAPAIDTVGIYSTDKTTCTYPTGEKITFAVPWVTQGSGKIDFALKDKSGQPCATVLLVPGVAPAPTEMHLTTKSGHVAALVGPQYALKITCPDGRVATTTNYLGKDFGACGYPASGRGTRLDPRPDATATQLDFFKYGESSTNGAQLMLCAPQ